MNVSGSSKHGRYTLVTEINLVPLIDVALVLLIIFMVMTPMLVQSEIKINLPKSAVVEPVKSEEKPLRAHVREDGAIFLEEQSVSDDVLEQTLAALVTDPATQGLLIEADKHVSFERVVLVMGAAKKLGITRMSVGVIEEKAPSSTRKR